MWAVGAVWLGGLLVIVLLRPVLGRERLPDVLSRYSSIALAASAGVSMGVELSVSTLPSPILPRFFLALSLAPFLPLFLL